MPRIEGNDNKGLKVPQETYSTANGRKKNGVSSVYHTPTHLLTTLIKPAKSPLLLMENQE